MGNRKPSGLVKRGGVWYVDKMSIGISEHPARCVRFDQVLGVIAQSLADLEYGPELVVSDASDPSALIHSPRNLIQIAPRGRRIKRAMRSLLMPSPSANRPTGRRPGGCEGR
jgi:hypothetical protein